MHAHVCAYVSVICIYLCASALFRHLNVQKWPEDVVGLPFSHPNMICTTTPCSFSTFQTSESAPTLWCFYHFDFEMCFAPQWRAIFISHLPRRLRTRDFSEPNFGPSGSTEHWKTQCFMTFLPFRAPAFSFFWLFLFSDLFLLLWFLFSPRTALTPVASVHIVGSLISKLPSMRWFKIVTRYWHGLRFEGLHRASKAPNKKRKSE